MDIERTINFEDIHFSVNVPKKNKVNKSLGHYVTRNLDKNILREVCNSNKIVRYKHLLACNVFIIDLNTDEFISFTMSRDRLVLPPESGIYLSCMNEDLSRSRFNNIYNAEYFINIRIQAQRSDKISRLGLKLENLLPTSMINNMNASLLKEATQRVLNERYGKKKEEEGDTSVLQEESVEIL